MDWQHGDGNGGAGSGYGYDYGTGEGNVVMAAAMAAMADLVATGRNHGVTRVAVIERGRIGGGNPGRNTTIVRSNLHRVRALNTK